MSIIDSYPVDLVIDLPSGQEKVVPIVIRGNYPNSYRYNYYFLPMNKQGVILAQIAGAPIKVAKYSTGTEYTSICVLGTNEKHNVVPPNNTGIYALNESGELMPGEKTSFTPQIDMNQIEKIAFSTDGFLDHNQDLLTFWSIGVKKID